MIGQEGVNFGFLLFESEGAWRAFADVARQTVPLPPVEPLKVLSLELLPMRAEDGSAFILPDPGGSGAGGWRALDERELRLAIYAAQGLDRFLQERARDILEAVEAGEGRRIEGRYAIRPPGFEKRSIRLSLSL
ncbi:MAG TPA: hypothetical protein RMH85_20980 [Polyangiaceae bacterium LLY-WYZ-15_(1-7)]|nr:hypothetical protein [Myxococcales bacterium]MAT26855.1 hypothetical protein [Sandaracinus sp.]HJK91055.1 hypothetical protein [Polyangiaceae bacterium LLY-WYZ-15_(1-7)]MBJ69914.1 hypothetical protein [Sandaracinus sp.]HJL02725.1 hypothetical protein [Polyangiaceae bacterium LLY-WYZ-15_(1-7)]